MEIIRLSCKIKRRKEEREKGIMGERKKGGKKEREKGRKGERKKGGKEERER